MFCHQNIQYAVMNVDAVDVAGAVDVFVLIVVVIALTEKFAIHSVQIDTNESGWKANKSPANKLIRNGNVFVLVCYENI